MTSKRGIVITVDPQGNLNQVLRDDFDLHLTNLIGDSISALFDEGSRAKLHLFLQEIVEEQAAFHWELNILRGLDIETLVFIGSRIESGIIIAASPTMDEMQSMYEEIMRMNNEGVNSLRHVLKQQSELEKHSKEQAVFVDELSRLNNDLLTLQRELAKKNHELEMMNEEKTRFLSMAAHDLRNPLHIIMGYASFLLESTEGDLDQEKRTFLNHIYQSSEFMQKLVEDLLDISAIESGAILRDTAETNIAELVASSVEMNRIIAGQKGIGIELHVSDQFPPVMLDDHKIRQVLNNLLTNAIKFSHRGTCILVTVISTSDQVMISVSDQGQGIPSSELDMLFQPFARTTVKSTAGEKSTGLGLAISRKIVHAHGGSLTVESTEGKGSTFSISLPIAKA